MSSLSSCVVAAVSVVAIAVPLTAQTTQRVSVDSGGLQGNGDSLAAAVSADGRWVAFYSYAANLVAGDTNGAPDVFIRDRLNGVTARVSLATGGVQANGASYYPTVSADGRYVAFESNSSNLIAGDTNLKSDVFIRDRQTGSTERVSVATGGEQANDNSYAARISGDGRYVAFYSMASNLVAGDTNAVIDVFVHDRQTGTTERVSVNSSGAQGNGLSGGPAISADGRYVGFYSGATNLVVGDTNGTFDVFVHDRLSGATDLVSVSTSGVQGNDVSFKPSLSSDGRFVSFESRASTLVNGDANGTYDVFLRDRQSGTTERVSVSTNGTEGNNESRGSSVSASGRYVAFHSWADNLVNADTNVRADVFVRDRLAGTTIRMSVASGGTQGNDQSDSPSITGDGRYVVFQSAATNLVAGDTNGFTDIFVRDRNPSGFTSLCDPGVGGVIACPCANPPSGPGRGCNNSAATGGANLLASGVAYLSLDSLVFTTNGEKPTATSIVLQGTSSPPGGMVYGQGVRCVGGTLKRLFVKAAVGGSIIAPNFGSGDPTVSARSAAKGDVIQPGQSRWYLVYYRDPIVLGGCPASSTFNATQTGRVDWSL
jgi:hypothetical protein